MLAIRGDNVNVLEALWGTTQAQLTQPQAASESESESESESGSGSDAEATIAPEVAVSAGAEQAGQCSWRAEVAELLKSADTWDRTPMMYAAMLHHRLWPHDATEGETESLEWLRSKLGISSEAAPADAAEVDWRRKNNIGGEWEGRQGAMSQGDRVGMLLDLDRGTLTLYKNDILLGAMVNPAHALRIVTTP
eukprot:COSAG03_NODE_6347_length_1075_cov_1.825820_1_plen_192_part_10